MRTRARKQDPNEKEFKFGVVYCAWCHKPFGRLRPWARFCSKRCRARHFDAFHPRRKDIAAGKKAIAERLLARTQSG